MWRFNFKRFDGLYSVHLELTSLCNKNCHMCGRRKIDRDYPELKINYGHMDFKLVEKIADELPSGINVQLHNNGEPTLYPRLGEAIKLFKDRGIFVQFNTNGKLIVEKANEIIDNLDSLCISVIENDEDAEEQYENVVKFLELKKDKKPIMVYRLLGEVKDRERWEKLEGIIANRVLHNPMGSRGYKKPVTIPETGVCNEILTHMAINKDGEVSLCVRFDPLREGVIGNVNNDNLADIWNGKKRQNWVKLHREGRRNEVPLCSKCEFWGIPRG